MGKTPKLSHRLLEELRRADKEIAEQWPTQLDSGLGRVGLILEPTLKDRYCDFCTPTNCWTFAQTGGDGVHYSLLATGAIISEDAPVIMTTPAYGGLSWVMGESLFDFLCLGSVRGYFGLDELAYEPEVAIQSFMSESTQQTEDRVDADVQRILEFLTTRFKLQPWTNAERFNELQDRFGKLLELPPGMVG